MDAVDREAYEEWHEMLLTRLVPVEGPTVFRVADMPIDWQVRLVVSLLASMARWATDDHWVHAVIESRRGADQ